MTEPLIEYYRQRGVLYQFKGETSDEITPQLFDSLEQFFKK